MASPFVEAIQFKGVFAKPEALALADNPSSGLDQATRDKLREKPAFTGDVSIRFKNGGVFDIQEDHDGQYLVLEPVNGIRPRVNIGDWLCLMSSGKFIVLKDADYKSMVGG